MAGSYPRLKHRLVFGHALLSRSKTSMDIAQDLGSTKPSLSKSKRGYDLMGKSAIRVIIRNEDPMILSLLLEK